MVEVACLGCIGVALLAAVLLYLGYCGLFYPIALRTAKPPHICDKLSILYKIHIGPYRKIGSLFSEVGKLLPNCDGDILGIYYDDPNTV